MYPEDLEPGKRHLALFFAQYWGGGDVYGRERGHPRLRMRHAPFPITPEAALRWAELMAASIDEQPSRRGPRRCCWLRRPGDADADQPVPRRPWTSSSCPAMDPGCRQ
jgi:truncated hemoglobin YjbI